MPSQKRRTEVSFQERAIIKFLPTISDRTATLQSDVARLNAVNPDFKHCDKAVQSLFVAILWLTKSFDCCIESAEKTEAYRTDLSLETAYQMVLDFRRGVPTIHVGKAIESQVRKNEDLIWKAYNETADLYSMRPDELIVFRNMWTYTCVALRKCAIQPYRHKLGRLVFDLRFTEKIDDNDAYYLARVLDSKSATSDPKYQTPASRICELRNDFYAISADLNRVILAMRNYRSDPVLQTIALRDSLVALFEMIAVRFRALEERREESSPRDRKYLGTPARSMRSTHMIHDIRCSVRGEPQICSR